MSRRVNVVKRGDLERVVAAIDGGMSLEQALIANEPRHVCETCAYRGQAISTWPCNQCTVPRRTNDYWKAA